MNALGTQLFSDEELQILETYRVPRPDTWGLSSPALVVVDMTESFVGPDLPVPEAQRECPTACGENAWRAIERVQPLLAAFRAAGAPVAFTGFGFLPPAPGAPVLRPPTALRPDVVVEQLSPRAGELELVKVKPSAFFGTPLLTWLVTRQVDQVVVVGGTTSGCVRGTALDAYSHGFDVLVPRDGCFDRVQTSHEVTLTDLDIKYARTVTCADVIDRLGERR